jgi:pimeloyl-ACP methyl ester carboxylesterase
MSRSRGLLVAIAASLAALVPVPATADPPARVVVATFDVVNTDTSRFPCLADGLRYKVRGDLAVPRSGMDAVTLYLHGAAGNHFRYGDIDPVYDFPAQMASRGHASLTLDMLGYGRSDKPTDGNALCTGSLADMAHQVVTALRTGSYTVDRGPRPPRFDRVAISGHSSGGLIAQIEAYSYHDVDALILTGIADILVSERGAQPWADIVAHIAQTCLTGGEAGRKNYTYTWPSPEAMARDMFFNVDPRIPEAFPSRAETDPCGDRLGVVPALGVDEVFMETIDVPVLVVHGDHDFAVQPPAGEQQCPRYLVAPSCSFVRLPDTGHMLHLERTAPLFHHVLDLWLDAHLQGETDAG